jgi:hypothetical protein
MVSGLILRTLIHFELTFIQSEGQMLSFTLLHVFKGQFVEEAVCAPT